MIAARRVRAGLAMLSEIIAIMSADKRHLTLAHRILTPFGRAEMGLGSTFQGEFLFATTIFRGDLDGEVLEAVTEGKVHLSFVDPLFKRNATINLMHRRYRFLDELSELPSNEFAGELVSGEVDQVYDAQIFSWHSLYNPIGKVIASFSSLSTWTPYMGRVKNLEALRRLVALQLIAKERHVDAESMVSLATNVGEELRNPYTGEPATWNTADRSFSFNGFREDSKTAVLGHAVRIEL